MNHEKQQGFSIMGLMAVVAIVAVLALVTMPIYNHYIETTKVSNAIPSVGNYKQGVASCFLENDTLEVCNAGESGIPEGLDNEGRVLSLDVFEGNITMLVDAENHTTDTTPIELAYVTDPETAPTDASLDWTLLCNGYVGDGSRLMDSCKGNTNGENNDLVWEPTTDATTEWENTTQGSYSAWQPPVNNQTSDFEQSRTFEQQQQRERIVQERNRLDGTVREIERITETRTITDTETRMVSVDVQTGDESSNWSDVGGLYECSDWTPARDTAYVDEQITQTRECSQDQEKIIEYTAEGELLSTLEQDRTLNNVDDSRDVSGTDPLWVDASDVVGDWSDTSTTRAHTDWTPSIAGQESDFTQTRDFEQQQQRTIKHREQNQRTGEYRNTGTTTETQYVDRTESRTVAASIQSGDGSDEWTNTSGLYNCGEWSPDRDTAYVDEQIEQTRQCSQDQEKVIEYTVGGDVVDTTTKTRTQNDVTDTQTVSGTKPLWIDTDDNIGEWQWVEPRQYTSDWSPAIDGQESNFEQTRDYERDRERTIETREQNQRTGDIRIVTTSTETDTQTGTESRTVSVEEATGGSSVVERNINCRNWTPDPSTKPDGQNFTQTGTCQERVETTTQYIVDGNVVKTQTESYLRDYSKQRETEGTKVVAECRFETIEHSGYTSMYTNWGNGPETLFWNWHLVNNSAPPEGTYVLEPRIESRPTKNDPYIENGYKYWTGDYIDRRHIHRNLFGYEVCREKL